MFKFCHRNDFQIYISEQKFGSSYVNVTISKNTDFFRNFLSILISFYFTFSIEIVQKFYLLQNNKWE
jgi:hypothetical protein